MPSVKVWVSPIDRKHPASDAITPQNNTAPQRIMGRHLDDRGVLALAAVVESLFPMRDRRPPVSVGVADHRRP